MGDHLVTKDPYLSLSCAGNLCLPFNILIWLGAMVSNVNFLVISRGAKAGYTRNGTIDQRAVVFPSHHDKKHMACEQLYQGISEHKSSLDSAFHKRALELAWRS